MTTLATRTASTPAVIEGRLVETAPPVPAPPMPPPEFGSAVAAGQRTYVHNPYLVPLVGSVVCTLIAGAGTAWSLYQDYTRADLAFGLVLGLIFVLTVTWRRFWAWNEA